MYCMLGESGSHTYDSWVSMGQFRERPKDHVYLRFLIRLPLEIFVATRLGRADVLGLSGMQ